MRAVIKTRSDYRYVGIGVAESGCWSMLKAGLNVDSSGPAELYFEVPINLVSDQDLFLNFVNLLFFLFNLLIERKHKSGDMGGQCSIAAIYKGAMEISPGS